jgi:carboxyl-terminal processing protease
MPMMHLPLSPARSPWRALRGVALAGLALLLAACGGGGGDPGVSPFPSRGGGGDDSGIPPSSNFAGRLVSTNASGALDQDWVASTCTAERHRNWVRSIVHEKHLFYREVPDINPNLYTGTPQDLFYELTRLGVPNGRDRFSFVIRQSAAEATFEQGQGLGIGANYVYDGLGRLRVSYVETGSPAAGRLARGAQIVAINGTAVGPRLTSAQIEALYPATAGGTLTLEVRDTPAGVSRTVSFTNAVYNLSAVHQATVLPGNVGYLHLTDFSTPSGQNQLADALTAFADAGIGDLVLDLRYNGGGYLAIASQLGHMVAGSRGSGRVFERLVYSDKRSRENQSVPFYDRLLSLGGYTNPRAGQVLPTLGLDRVFVLTTGDSCSASESLISGLRGVGVEVVLVGAPTCGKPYGFTQYRNCTYAYFPIEFEGRNDRDERFPDTGIVPTCTVPDDLDTPLGQPGEALLDAALAYRRDGRCPPVEAGVTAQQARSAASQPWVRVGSPAPEGPRSIKLLTP